MKIIIKGLQTDIAYFSFTNKPLKSETIQIFNYENCKWDFGFKPSSSLRTEFRRFAEWYREFYVDKKER